MKPENDGGRQFVNLRILPPYDMVKNDAPDDYEKACRQFLCESGRRPATDGDDSEDLNNVR